MYRLKFYIFIRIDIKRSPFGLNKGQEVKPLNKSLNRSDCKQVAIEFNDL